MVDDRTRKSSLINIKINLFKVKQPRVGGSVDLDSFT